MEMIGRYGLALATIGALSTAAGCGGANPFTLLIDNASEEVLSLDGDSGRSSVTVFVVEEGDQLREVGEHDSCFRECGESELVCVDMGAPAPGVWALLPGDTLDMEYSGTEWIQATDMRGDCQKEQALSGDLLAEVCFGRGVVDYEGEPWSEDIDESGFVFDADFVEYDCAEVEFTLPEDIEVVVGLAFAGA